MSAKTKLHRFFAVSVLLASLQSNAQLATNVPGVFPDTNVVQSFRIGFAQGTCNDGTNVYMDLTSLIQWRNTNYYGPLGGFGAAGGITNGLPDFFPRIHLGDPDYYQGRIYVPLESAVGVPQGSAIIDIEIFTTSNMTRCAAVSISNYQSEVSAVCIDPVFSNSVALFATSWASTSTNDGIYEYSVNNLTNITFVEALPMTQRIKNMQGIVCVAGMLYVIGDNGPAGEIYQVNPTNGVVVHLAQVNIAGESEWEGLDYLDGYLVANEGATGTADWFDFFGVQNASAMHSITGSVRDSQNNPIAGVEVSAAATADGTDPVPAADTDTDGNYSLSTTNGNWTVTVNYNNGGNSLSKLGAYSPPDSQNVNLANNNAIANFIVQICNGVAIINASTLPAGEAGVYYNQTLQASSCNPGYAWTQTGGSLPSGLSLSTDGILSGTPAGPGDVFNFTVQVTDGNNATTNQNFSLGISNAVQIATTALPDGTSCNVTLSAGNGLPPYVWSLTPGSASLPSNLSLTTNGLLSGTAAADGAFNFSVRVTDALAGIADQLLVINLFQPLSISVAAGQISVLWPAAATNYVLQSTTNLALPDWETVTGAAPGSTFTFSNSPPAVYFRLH